jgi:DNA-binding NtrC family response regulator
MTTILLVDDALDKRKTLIEALGIQYEVAEIDQPNRTSEMIKKLAPSIVLINRLSLNFNAVSLFLNIKKHYQNMPVLLYVLSDQNAISVLKQTIIMALSGEEVVSEFKTDPALSFLFRQNGVASSFLR